jgi:hypothetical protein
MQIPNRNKPYPNSRKGRTFGVSRISLYEPVKMNSKIFKVFVNYQLIML